VPDFIPKEEFEKCCIEVEGMWKDEKPKRWYYFIPIIIVGALKQTPGPRNTYLDSIRGTHIRPAYLDEDP
jgi:hypothetical protein